MIETGIFNFWMVLRTAAMGAVAGLVMLRLLRRGSGEGPGAWASDVAACLVLGLSILAWRLAANVAALNDDPIPLFSPNDLLCPVVSYVTLGVYGALRPAGDTSVGARSRAWLTLVSLVVNVVTI